MVVSRMLPPLPSLPPSRGTDGGIGVGRSSRGGEAVTAESFARDVQDSWGVGKEACDNGFVLVASREDRSFAISVVSLTGISSIMVVVFYPGSFRACLPVDA